MSAKSKKFIKIWVGSLHFLTVCLVQIAKLQVSRIGQESKVGKGGGEQEQEQSFFRCPTLPTF